MPISTAWKGGYDEIEQDEMTIALQRNGRFVMLVFSLGDEAAATAMEANVSDQLQRGELALEMLIPSRKN